jgi:hypothetical protein
MHAPFFKGNTPPHFFHTRILEELFFKIQTINFTAEF